MGTRNAASQGMRLRTLIFGNLAGRVGSILHGAYGDYYEQMVCLRYLKQTYHDVRLIVFFATEPRRRELEIFDLSFADEVYPASAIESVEVDGFFQFQIFDSELQEEVLSGLSKNTIAKFDFTRNLKPWSLLRLIYKTSLTTCDIPLSSVGLERLPGCFHENEIDVEMFDRDFTIGFLWRHRLPGDVAARGQTPEDVVLRTKSQLLGRLAQEFGAKIIISGMNVRKTADNKWRIDGKYTDKRLALPDGSCTYLKGLSWGLELEIMRRCSLCLVMPSGFAEALFLKRSSPTVLVDPSMHYIAKLLWNRMPFFKITSARDLLFELHQPHTLARVLKYLRFRRLLPDS